jgi:hypothetical protein
VQGAHKGDEVPMTQHIRFCWRGPLGSSILKRAMRQDIKYADDV